MKFLQSASLALASQSNIFYSVFTNASEETDKIWLDKEFTVIYCKWVLLFL